jgi:glycosyltransferase involved in cell wall biosynthesis
MNTARISVVTPTYLRPQEISELLLHLKDQTVLPFEVILIDGADPSNKETENAVAAISQDLPYRCTYLRHDRGTAIQRNAGIENAQGDFVAFIDDDIRLDADYFEQMLAAYAEDKQMRVGGIAGYITNQYLDASKSPRWRWYRRLRLFGTYQPGRYDYTTGYPINRYLHPPHAGLREIDFMGSNCGVWRREVFDRGLRFSPFFADYGVLEDAHLALRARRDWTLWECGKAHCQHFHSPRGRINKRRLAWKTAVNYRYVFVDIVRHRSWRQNTRFWVVQAFELFRLLASAVRKGGDEWSGVLGKAEGILAATRLRVP